jgi:conjugal transfer pilin signal peptidase TrbI
MSARNPERTGRRKPGAFLARALPVLALVVAAGAYLEHRFRLGIDDQKELCLPGNHRWFLIDRMDRDIWRGDLLAFGADQRMAPWFPLNQVVVKIATGVSGDRVEVTVDHTRINETAVADGLALAEKLNRQVTAFFRSEVIPPGSYWVTGTHPRSFDSRYWGYVNENQIVGRAYALPF